MNTALLLAAFVSGPVVGFVGVGMGWRMALRTVRSMQDPGPDFVNDGPKE